MIPIELPQSAQYRREMLQEHYVSQFGRPVGKRLFATSIPLRLCPLGAHSDHQKGLVTGFAIDRSIDVVGTVSSDTRAEIYSTVFEERASLDLNSSSERIPGDWVNYARGAVSQLRSFGLRLQRGMRVVVSGTMPIGGLSSSAAVTIAYLKALAFAQEKELSARELISLVLGVENEYLGLHNGILDQSVILFSRQGALTVIDCGCSDITTIDGGRSGRPWELLVVYSGLSRQLTATPFNQRVAECRAAAAELLRLAGKKSQDAPTLGDVPRDVYEFYKSRLATNLAKRARHFFSEGDRVRQGIDLWATGDLTGFGQLMTQSGDSSIVNYESGSPALISLYGVLAKEAGVYGARFCGGGFQGCCMALIDSTMRDSIVSKIHREYVMRHPELADSYSIHSCQTSQLGAVEEFL